MTNFKTYTIGEICYIKRGRVVSKEYLAENKGEFPVYSSQTFNNGEIGRIKTYDFDGEYLTWTTDGAYAGSVFYRNGKFSATNICGLLKVKKPDEVSAKFLSYLLQIKTKDYVNQGMGNPKLMSNVMEKIEVSIPPLPTQLKVVEILDKFTELQTELQKELKLRKKQYEYYRDKLLTFSEEERERWGVRDVRIGECCEVLTGGEVPEDCMKGQKEPNEIYKYPVYTNGVEVYGYSSKYRVDKEAVTISSIGNVGYVAYRDEKFFPAIRLKVIIPKDKDIDTRYLYYIVKCIKFKGTNSSLSSMNSNDVKKYIISIPTLTRQKEIVEILDKFDTLVNDISKGLPREIALRRKQYEYYRERLVSFC